MALTRIMYIESKAESLQGTARIGRVRFSRSRRSVFYQEKEFIRSTRGFKANYIEAETWDPYWISGPKHNGLDRLYGPSALPVEIDDDVREEYWREIRKKPELASRCRA